MYQDYVDVTIRCRCALDWKLCVPVNLAVPSPLHCNPGPPIRTPDVARTDICCLQCRRPLFRDHSALVTAVEDALRRGRGTHVRAGTVVIDCR
jgi:hypothetical protein